MLTITLCHACRCLQRQCRTVCCLTYIYAGGPSARSSSEDLCGCGPTRRLATESDSAVPQTGSRQKSLFKLTFEAQMLMCADCVKAVDFSPANFPAIRKPCHLSDTFLGFHGDVLQAACSSSPLDTADDSRTPPSNLVASQLLAIWQQGKIGDETRMVQHRHRAKRRRQLLGLLVFWVLVALLFLPAYRKMSDSSQMHEFQDAVRRTAVDTEALLEGMCLCAQPAADIPHSEL